MSDYENGKADAFYDYANEMAPAILRGKPVEYRNGYSDGWHLAQGAPESW